MAIGVTEVIGSTPSTFDLRQLLDKGQHGVQLALQMRNLGLGYRDPRQMRDTADGVGIDGHYIGPPTAEISPPYSRGGFCAATAPSSAQPAIRLICASAAPANARVSSAAGISPPSQPPARPRDW